MPIKSLLFLLLFLMQPTIRAQQVQSPSAFLGYELGTQFTRHHRVMDYYEHLAENDSKRIQLVAYGTTYENRPLMLAYISSEENMARLDQIRQEHLENINGNGKPTKAIVWMSYNVHGNESVSTEASMQEALDQMNAEGIVLDAMRVRAFPFNLEVWEFIEDHDLLFIVEQNRDGQMRTLIMAEGGIIPDKLVSILCFDGQPITADFISNKIRSHITGNPAKSIAGGN